MKTYAIRNARTKLTGHLRRPGTRDAFGGCGPIGVPNGDFHGLKGWKMCTRCVKAEARDRAEALATATAVLDPATVGTLPAMVCISHGTECTGNPKRRHIYRAAQPATCSARRPGWTTGPAIGTNRLPCVLDPDHTDDHRNAFGQTWPDYAAEKAAALAVIAAEESRHAAELVTEAEATDGTWRGQWIGARDTTAPTLFDVPADREQGALFA